jgi:RNA-directed DNA polymerase
VDCDIKGCFDNVDHAALMGFVRGFSASWLIERWLKAGIMEGEIFTESDVGGRSNLSSSVQYRPSWS